jgi:hypothetical protein
MTDPAGQLPPDPFDDEDDAPPLDQEAADAAFVAAEEAADDDSDLADEAEDLAELATRRRRRLAPLKERILTYLRHEGDQWEPWPEVVEAVDGRMLAEISPINGRIRQAALALSRDGQVEIRYGARSIFEAVRLLPAGYTDDED